MSRLSLCIVLGFGLMLSLPLRAADEEHRVTRQDPKPKDVDQVIHDQLDRKLPEINFNGNQFTDVIDFLRDVTGANIFVNWRALEAAGIDKAATVTVRVKDVKFEKALKIILDGVSGEKAKLAFVIDEGVITISTVDDLRKNTATKSYDIRDLLGGKAQTPENRQERVDAIFKLVTGSVDPESWRDNGGQIGAIKELSGQLIVTQSPANQKAIENLITQSRKLFGSEAKDK